MAELRAVELDEMEVALLRSALSTFAGLCTDGMEDVVVTINKMSPADFRKEKAAMALKLREKFFRPGEEEAITRAMGLSI